MRGRQSSCCFTGHRPAKLPWGFDESDARCAALKQRIYDAAATACEEGYTHFLCGMAMGCDLYFAEAVLALKEKYPGLTLEAAVPCLSQTDGWPEEQRQRYRRLLEACDYETVVQEQYTRDCMQRRNRYMVDHASLLIAVHDGLPGGTRSTVLYAMRRGLMVVNLPL
ncbi:MAG: SLOG family protein [Oscillospiraceae bacterium]